MSSNGERSPEQIEEEISRTRAEMSDTLDAIQRKLSPGQVLDQALHYLRDGPGDYFTHLGQSIKDNPLPVAMMGLSMGWLALTNRQNGAVHHYDVDAGTGDSATSGISSRMSEAGEKLRGMGDGAAGGASHKLGEASQKLHGMADKGQRGLQSARAQAGRWSEGMRGQSTRAREGFDHLLQDQPLVLGVVGVALGAALGALIPGTRQEDALMGEVADDVRAQAREFGEAQLEKAEHVAERAGEAASEQARKETGAGEESRPH